MAGFATKLSNFQHQEKHHAQEDHHGRMPVAA
jgi:hypothetical protein